MPADCSNSLPEVFADGFIPSPHNRPYKIEVKPISVNNEESAVTGILGVKFELRNIGADAIQIPWSTNPDVIKKGQDPKHLGWNEAHFYVSLKGLNTAKSVVRDLSKSLFGSKYSTGTQLTIHPGEWIAVITHFQLTPHYIVVPHGEGGEPSHLSVWLYWEYRSLDFKNDFLPAQISGPCQIISGSFGLSYQEEGSKLQVYLKAAR